jgi:hypothetical protein
MGEDERADEYSDKGDSGNCDERHVFSTGMDTDRVQPFSSGVTTPLLSHE